jgi:hypothetical protein
MRRPRITAVIALLIIGGCLAIPVPTQAGGPFTAWYLRGTERVPIMIFADAEACARAAETLAAKAETHVGCVEGLLPDSEPLKPDTLEPSASLRQPRQPRPTQPSVSCSITGTDFGLTAICKSF